MHAQFERLHVDCRKGINNFMDALNSRMKSSRLYIFILSRRRTLKRSLQFNQIVVKLDLFASQTRHIIKINCNTLKRHSGSPSIIKTAENTRQKVTMTRTNIDVPFQNVLFHFVVPIVERFFRLEPMFDGRLRGVIDRYQVQFGQKFTLVQSVRRLAWLAGYFGHQTRDGL